MFSAWFWGPWGLLLSVWICEALTIFPPPSPVFLGTTIHVTWTSDPEDPPSFDLSAQCEGTISTPSVTVNTAAGQIFFPVPLFFNIDILLHCFALGKTTGQNPQLLSQSATFDLILQNPSILNSLSPASDLHTVPLTPTKASLTLSSFRSTSSIRTSSSILTAPVGETTVDLTSLFNPQTTAPRTSVSFSTVLPQSAQTSGPSVIASSSTSSQPPPTTGASVPSSKKPPIGTIVGATVGGLSFICVLAVSLLWYRRRHERANVPILEVLPYQAASASEDTNLGPEAFQTTHNAPSSTGLLAEEGEDELRLMVQQMSERILVLEADVNEVQPPPNYSDPPLSPLGPDSPENVVLPESSRLDSVPHAI